MRGLAALSCAALAFAIPASASASEGEIVLEVAGPPVAAEETQLAFFYSKPKADPRYPGGGVAEQGWSMLGREDRAAQTSSEYSARACTAAEPSATGQGAVIAQIAEQARLHRVVIINESHTVTRHRDFSRQVITALRPLGFTVFAAETFGNNADKPDPVDTYAGLPYVDHRIGWYSRESAFGGLLRTAKTLGFRFAAYEKVYTADETRPDDMRVSIAQRETAQAQNLADIIANMGAEEKIVIHVGFAHARESISIDEDGFENAWMAARLKRVTGLDPLTIAQTQCSGSGDAVRLWQTSPSGAGSFDLLVDHPQDGFLFGRPVWRFTDGRRPAKIPEALKPESGPLVIEAFYEGDPFEAVPADRIWAEPGEDVRLSLRPGRYRVRAVEPQVTGPPSPPAKPG